MTSREQARGRSTEVDRNACNLRHNNCQRPLTHWPSNASTPTEPTGRCLFIQTPVSETADYKGAQRLCQARTRDRVLKQPLQQMPDSIARRTNNHHQHQTQQHHHELELPVTVLVRWCQRTLREIWWRSISSHTNSSESARRAPVRPSSTPLPSVSSTCLPGASSRRESF